MKPSNRKRRKKRLSRRVRKLIKAGKFQTENIDKKEGQTTGQGDRSFERDHYKEIELREKESSLENVITAPDVNPLEIQSTENIQEKEYFKNIFQHIKVVIITSVLCLVILGGAFFLDKRMGLVDNLSNFFKNDFFNWDWKI